MLRVRWILLTLTMFLGGGSICATVAMAWYLHSPLRAEQVVDGLAGASGFPVHIDDATATGWRGGTFSGLRVLSAGQGPEWLSCAAGRWERGPAELALEARELRIVLADRGWSAAHPVRVADALRACGRLWPDVRRVDVHDAHATVIGGAWRARIGAFDGTLHLDEDGLELVGQARSWDGHALTTAVGVEVTMTALDDPQTLAVRLSLPGMGVAHWPLAWRAQNAPVAGEFQGNTAYRAGAWHVQGTFRDLRLAEWINPGLAGRIDHLEVEEAVLRDDRLERLVCRGRIDDIDIAPLWWGVDQPPAGGCATLTIDLLEWAPGGAVSFEGRARVDGIDVMELTAAWGQPAMTGHLTIDVEELKIVDGAVVGLVALFRIDPPVDRRGIVDRVWIDRAAALIPFLDAEHLPEGPLEYSELAGRVVVADDRAWLFGAGDDGRTALDLRFLGRTVPVIRLPTTGVDISSSWSDIRVLLTDIIGQDVVRRAIGGYAGMTASNAND